MINFLNLKNQIIGYTLAFTALVLAIFHIRKGGSDAQKQKYTEATLENVAKATTEESSVNELLNNPIERKRLRNKWRTPRK